MSQSLRQSELFAGSDWRTIYRTFTKVNFNAYDHDSIFTSMTDYIRTNYPEDFNDWIASSEFVSILELLATLAESLAFRMDLNTRENFLDTAERRDSILRLARFISYSPRRNYPARGLVKLVQISTDDDLIDSSGDNLNNRPIRWNDSQNSSWFEQFKLIINSALIPTNPYGIPLNQTLLDGINTQLYRVNSIPVSAGNFPFTAVSDGASRSFDIINVDFDDVNGFTERTPDPQASFHMIYRNDGNGNGSKDTGFFLYFKQGSLTKEDFQLSIPVENKVLDLSRDNCNETDVWVQTINDQGLILNNGEWNKVQAVLNTDVTKTILTGQNITFNDTPVTVRKIFQTITRDNDQLSIRFGDGRFGEIPLGLLRVWYRTSSGDSYTIRPQDMSNIQVVIPYTNKQNFQKKLTLTFSLQETVINSTPAEADADIKRRCGQVFYTQNRMVNGEDYNTFPLQNNLALKLKGVNRTYAGHSRFIDLNDPTSTYQKSNVFSDDGILYRDFDNSYEEVDLNYNKTSTEAINQHILTAIQINQTRDFAIDWLLTIPESNQVTPPYLWWVKSSNQVYSSTGTFSKSNTIMNPPTSFVNIGGSAPLLSNERLLIEGSLIKFSNGGWVAISSIDGDGKGFLDNGKGKVIINENIQTNDKIIKILPAFRQNFTAQEFSNIKVKLDAHQTFGLGFDYKNNVWYVVEPNKINLSGDFDFTTKGTTSDSSWIVKVQFNNASYKITCRGIKHVFESLKDVRFFNINKYKVIDPLTGLAVLDKINILKTNDKENGKTWIIKSDNGTTTLPANDTLNFSIDGVPYALSVFSVLGASTINVADINYIINSNSFLRSKSIVSYLDISGNLIIQRVSNTGFKLVKTTTGDPVDLLFPNQLVGNIVTSTISNTLSLGQDYAWSLDGAFIYEDGFNEPRRVIITYTDSDGDGSVDNPESFMDIVNSSTYIFQQRIVTTDGYEEYTPFDAVLYWDFTDTSIVFPNINIGDILFDTNSKLFYSSNVNVVNGIPDLDITNNQISLLTDQEAYLGFIGRKNISFNWKHYATNEQRIDPSVSNIIDMFVLDRGYDTELRQWISSTTTSVQPQPPTSEQLRINFQDFENYKMFSDQIIWRPAKYKFLIGQESQPEIRATIKIVKLLETSLSDGEIKSQVISAIDNFFNIDLWDFGEVFYWSELSAYIHQSLANAVASVVIVPLNESSSFGDLYEIKSEADELFISTAKVSDIEIITSNTKANLRIK